MKRRLTLIDIYESYPYKERDSKYYVDKKTYVELNKDFYQLLMIYLITTGNTYKFPSGFGHIKVRKRRQTSDRIDFKKTRELGKTIYFTNMHSNGYYARFKWYKSKVYLQNKNMYKFVPVRAMKRLLAKEIKDNNTILNYTT